MITLMVEDSDHQAENGKFLLFFHVIQWEKMPFNRL